MKKKNRFLPLLILLLSCLTLSGGLTLFQLPALAGESANQAESTAELQTIIFNAIKNRQSTFRVRYIGNTEDIMHDVRTARDNAVSLDPYEEGCVSLIAGFKVSPFSDHADITFDSFQYYTTKEQEEYVDREIQRITGQVIRSGMNDYEKETAIVSYMNNNVAYDSSLAGYTAYSALHDGATVCNGYVQLAYRLLNQAGVETKIVKGSLKVNGDTKDHEWNLVKVNGSWYHLDPTLKKLNLSDEEILADHSFAQQAYPAAPSKFPGLGEEGINSPGSNGSGGSGSSIGSGSSGILSGYFSERLEGSKVSATLDKNLTLALLEKSGPEVALYELAVQTAGTDFEIRIPGEVSEKLYAKNKAGVLRLRTGIGWVDVPADEVVSALGSAEGEQAPVDLIISVGKEKGQIAAIEKMLARAGLTLQGAPVSFAVEIERGGVRKTLTGLGRFVAKGIILEQEIPGERAAGLEFDPEKGELHPVPAVFASENGKGSAAMFCRENGLFLVAVAGDPKLEDLAGHWAKSSVERLVAKQIIKGRDARHFVPQGKVTRAEFAAMLVRALGLAEPAESAESAESAEGPKSAELAQGPGTREGTGKEGQSDSQIKTKSRTGFRDVTTEWFAEPARLAAANNLISGYSDGSFRPNALISREEMAVMAARAIALAGGSAAVSHSSETPVLFRDQSKVRPWAGEAVALASRAGIIQGNQFGEFLPQAAATRAEAVVMIEKTLKAVGFIN